MITTFVISNKSYLLSFFIKGIAFAAILFLFLNLFFYPKLMQYQSGMMAAKLIKKNNDFRKAGMYGSFSYTFEFYVPSSVSYLHSLQAVDSFAKQNGHFVYTTPNALQEMTVNGKQARILQQFPYYRVTLLTGKFLNPATRGQATDTLLLAELKD
jgi:hypothetical protein